MASLSWSAPPRTLNRSWIWLLIGSLCWAGCSRPETYLSGVHALDDEKYDEAAATFADAIAQNPMHAQAAFRRAVALQKQKKLPEARAGYDDAIRINRELTDAKRLPKAERSDAVNNGVPLGSELVDVYIGRGAVYADMCKNDDAMDDFSEAIRLDPNRAEAYCRRGAVLLTKGFPDLALDNLTAAVQLMPDYVEALYQRARASLLTGEWRQAVQDCRHVLRLDAKYTRAYQVLAAAYCAASPPDYAKAIACYKEVTRLDQGLAKEVRTDLAKTYFQFGISLESAGKEKEAEEAFRDAAALDPKYNALRKQQQATVYKVGPNGQSITVQMPIGPNPKVEQFNQQGLQALQQSEWDKAIDSFGKAIQIDPNCADSHYGRGAAFLAKGFPDTAVEEFSRAILIKPDYAAACSERAWAYVMLGRYRAAEADATEAIRLNPAFATAYCNRANAYLRDGNFDRAIADFTEMVTLNPGLESAAKPISAEAYRGRGLEHLRREHWDAALFDLDMAVQYDRNLDRQLRPQMAEAHRNRGLDYARLGEFAKAIGDLNKAVQLEGSNAKNYEARGRTYFKSSQWSLAIADLKKARSLDPVLDYEVGRFLIKAEEILKKFEDSRTQGVSPASVRTSPGI